MYRIKPYNPFIKTFFLKMLKNVLFSRYLTVPKLLGHLSTHARTHTRAHTHTHTHTHTHARARARARACMHV